MQDKIIVELIRGQYLGKNFGSICGNSKKGIKMILSNAYGYIKVYNH